MSQKNGVNLPLLLWLFEPLGKLLKSLSMVPSVLVSGHASMAAPLVRGGFVARIDRKRGVSMGMS